MNILLDEIHVNGVEKPGRVRVSFSNIDLDFDVASARKLAKALHEE